MPPPDLSVIIVSWNVRDLLLRCLESIIRVQTTDDRRYTLPTGARQDADSFLSTDIWVVDNASTDGSAEMVRRRFPNVHLIENRKNRGFAAANNQGLAMARGRYFLLLNPDTEVVGDALQRMVVYMETHGAVGVLGPQLRYPNGEWQPSRRRFPSLATALLESTPLQQALPSNRVLQRYYMEDRPPDTVQVVDWLVGACLLVRRQVVEAAGGLDEGYFMYFEELDWCRRIRQAGWKVVYFPEAMVIHHEGRSSEQVVPLRHIRFQSSKVRYFTQHHGRWQGELVRWFLLSTYVWQSGVESFKWVLGHKRPLRSDRLRVYVQVLRSQLKGTATHP